jgi:hypothetical protein
MQHLSASILPAKTATTAFGGVRVIPRQIAGRARHPHLYVHSIARFPSVPAQRDTGEQNKNTNYWR